jgi:hypothetical protein
LVRIKKPRLSATSRVGANGRTGQNSWGEIVQPVGADAPEITARFRDLAGDVIGLYQQPT